MQSRQMAAYGHIYLWNEVEFLHWPSEPGSQGLTEIPYKFDRVSHHGFMAYLQVKKKKKKKLFTVFTGTFWE